MKKKSHLIVAIFISSNVFSQAPAIQWQNTIGGNYWDYLHSIQQTFDGGYILGGFSISDISGDKTESNNGYDDYWIVKTDSLGNVQWDKSFGGSNYDQLYSLKQTSDSGYFLCGRSKSNISNDKTENNWDTSQTTYDYWIIKTDSLGNIQWDNTIGGTKNDAPFSVSQTIDGGYIIGGYSNSNISGDKTENCMDTFAVDYWIVKTDSAGVIQWQNNIGGGGIDDLFTLQTTSDGGYVMGGYSESGISGDKTDSCYGHYDYWIVKTDSNGNIQWQNTIGGSNEDGLNSLQQTSDGGYILGGWSDSDISGDKTENCMGGYDYWIVKTDSLGNIQWQNTIGGNDRDVLNSVQQTRDGGYILGGFSQSDSSGDKKENTIGDYDYWIIKTDASGNIQWQKTIGGNNEDELISIQELSDGGYILGGTSSSNISGDKTENSNGDRDYWIIKLYPDTILTSINYSQQFQVNAIQIFPNPVKDEFRIQAPWLLKSNMKIEKTSIIDMFGKCVYSSALQPHQFQINFDVSFLSSGIYSVKILTPDGICTARFIKE